MRKKILLQNHSNVMSSVSHIPRKQQGLFQRSLNVETTTVVVCEYAWIQLCKFLLAGTIGDRAEATCGIRIILNNLSVFLSRECLYMDTCHMQQNYCFAFFCIHASVLSINFTVRVMCRNATHRKEVGAHWILVSKYAQILWCWPNVLLMSCICWPVSSSTLFPVKMSDGVKGTVCSAQQRVILIFAIICPTWPRHPHRPQKYGREK